MSLGVDGHYEYDHACEYVFVVWNTREDGEAEEGVHLLAEGVWPMAEAGVDFRILLDHLGVSCCRPKGPPVGLLHTLGNPESDPLEAPEGAPDHVKRELKAHRPFGGAAWVGSSSCESLPYHENQTFSGGQPGEAQGGAGPGRRTGVGDQAGAAAVSVRLTGWAGLLGAGAS